MIDQSSNTERTSRLAEIRDIAATVFNVEPGAVESADSFVTDLETDSLLAVELLVVLEKHFGVEISESEVPRMTDLRTVYEVVAENAGW